MVTVNATSDSPTHHLSLGDGTTTLGLILVNTRRERDPSAIQRSPIQRTPMKTATGATKYSDLEPPYASTVQDDWSGGRGLDDFDKDTTRFFDSYRVNTWSPNQIILGPQENYTYGYRGQNYAMPGNMSWANLYGSTTYIGRTFASGAGYDAKNIWLWLKRTGTPGAIHAELWSYTDANTPNAELGSVSLTYSNYEQYQSYLIQFVLSPAITLSATTNYFVVVHGSGTCTAASHWSVGYVVGAGVYSTAGSTWTASSTVSICYRVTDTDTPFKAHFFEYRGALYVATQPDAGGTGILYINGDRGCADSNAADLTCLCDATKSTSWTVDEWIGCIAKIIHGVGFEELQNWRTIYDNNNTVLYVTPDWNITHVVGNNISTTEYVILGSNKWTALTTTELVVPVTDVAIADDVVYLARGEKAVSPYPVIYKYQCYPSNTGVFTTSLTADAICATFLCPKRQPNGNTVMGLVQNEYLNGMVAFQEATIQKGYNLGAGIPVTHNDAPWNESTITNVTPTHNGQWALLTVADAFTTGILGTKAIASTDIRPYNKIYLEITSSINFDAGDLQLLLDNTAACASPVQTLNLPALKANVYQLVAMEYIPAIGDNANISVGLQCTSNTPDNGAYVIYLGGIGAKADTTLIMLGDQSEKATNIVLYDDPENYWIFKEGSIWQVKDGLANKVPIHELENVKSEVNGKAALVHDVYLYFSMASGSIEQYFRNNLVDVGPNRDTGLPFDRQGEVSCMVGYPGKIFASVDGGTDNYSSILLYQGGTLHEFYRAPIKGMRIYNLYIQVIPGVTADRLWVSMGADIIWLPISGKYKNHYFDPYYQWTQEGHIITGWYTCGMKDIPKLFKSVKLFSENMQGTNTSVDVYYQLDQNSTYTTWTKLSSSFDLSPMEEIDLSMTHNIVGKKIRFKFVLNTTSSALTPRINAYVMESLTQIPTKNQYTFTFKIPDGLFTLEDTEPDDTSARAETAIAQIDTWWNACTTLNMRSVFSPADNKYVKVDAFSWKPLTVNPEDQYEEHIAQLTVVEV